MKSIAYGRVKCCNSRNMETLSSNELSNFIICNDSLDTPHQVHAATAGGGGISCSSSSMSAAAVVVQGRKKRRRRAKVCKNKEEAESQRMTHIAVERNRRKQMNEHLAVLRSLMPESYVQRGDQASIVGGAIEFVKELEHVLQSLEAKKLATLGSGNDNINCRFSQFFTYPQFSSSTNYKYTSQNKAAIADIEVTLIETHANIRILSRRRIRQHSKIVAAFHTMFLSILHLNLTTFDPLVLYSISAKVEEGCQLNSADEIARAIHHMLRVIEEEAILSCPS